MENVYEKAKEDQKGEQNEYDGVEEEETEKTLDGNTPARHLFFPERRRCTHT